MERKGGSSSKTILKKKKKKRKLGDSDYPVSRLSVILAQGQTHRSMELSIIQKQRHDNRIN